MYRYRNFYTNIKAISKELTVIGNLAFKDYNSLCDIGGLCWGLTLLWAQAVLTNSSHIFYSTIKILTNSYDPNNNLAKQILAARDKFLKSQLLTSQELEILEISTFLDKLLLIYQIPEEFSNFSQISYKSFNTPKHIIPPAFSNKNKCASKSKSLVAIYDRPCIGNKENLKELIKNIVKTVSKLNITFVILLQSMNHMIGLQKYDHETIILYNTNFMVDDMLYYFTDDWQQVINAIFKHFNFNIQNNSLALNVVVCIAPLSEINKNDQVLNCKIHLPIIEKLARNYYQHLAKTIESQNNNFDILSSLFYIACHNGHLDIVKILLDASNQININFRKPDFSNFQ